MKKQNKLYFKLKINRITCIGYCDKYKKEEPAVIDEKGEKS